jgi:hypothetical protein
MPRIKITGPDGKSYMLSVPDGTDPAAAVAEFEREVIKVNLDTAKPQAAQAAAPEPLAWSDVPGQALRNAPESALNLGKSLVAPIMHPIETAKAVGGLALGVGSKLADAIPGVEMDPAAKAEREKYADAAWQHYSDRYGSVEGFKRALATDPGGVAADAGTVLTAGGGAAARLPGIAGKAGQVVKATGRAVDPIANVGRAVAGVADVLAPRRATKLGDVPTIEATKAAGRASYKAADEAGVVIAQPALQQLHAQVADDLTEIGYKPQLHPRIKTALDDIKNLANSNVKGTPEKLVGLERFEAAGETQPIHATLKGLDQTRKVVAAAGKSMDPTEKMLAAKIIDRIDDLFDGLDKPGMTIAGDAAAGAAALKEARASWAKARKAETISDAIEAAQLRAGTTGTGGNVENAIRQELRKIITDPKKGRGFTKEEKKAIKHVATGTGAQNVMRWLGRLSPEGNGLMLALHGLGGMASGGASIPLAIGGAVAKRAADRGTRLQAEALQNHALAGQIAKQRPRQAPEGLARALYATGEIEEEITPLVHRSKYRTD